MMMKSCLTLGLIGMIGISYADLTVVQDLGGVPLSNYLNMAMVPTQDQLNSSLQLQADNIQNAKIDITPLELPAAQHDFTPGTVVKHKISISLPSPIYVIGTDDQSVRWASLNATYLQSIQALGFIVDANSTEQIKNIEEKTGLTFSPGNIAGLSTIIGTSHYPFLIYQGWVTQ